MKMIEEKRRVTFPFNDLGDADLVVDAIYEGGTANGMAADPIHKLLPVGNQGGFRFVGPTDCPKILVLFTTGYHPDWPDFLDVESGVFTYYGDQRKPGKRLLDTGRHGNLILEGLFGRAQSGKDGRKSIPLILHFEKKPTKKSSRSVQFKGMMVPGTVDGNYHEDLVAIWSTTEGERFQNYRARFTVLDEPVVARKWLNSICDGVYESRLLPKALREWQNNGRVLPLKAPRTISIRSSEEQLPSNGLDQKILQRVFQHFRNDDRAFEFFAADLYAMSEPKAIIDEVTRGAVDGGRDAVGKLQLGLQSDPVYVEFALEAKCYNPGIGTGKRSQVGVKELSRLISRLLHRQFGVLVTTSVVGRQAYTEIKDDGHPIVFICGGDIVQVLRRNGYGDDKNLEELLSRY